MSNGRAFRSIGIAVAVVIALSLTGCGALGGGGGGGGCGPGDTKISTIAETESMTDQERVSFTGEVVENGGGAQTAYAIDDGTGTAFVQRMSGDLSEGDCVTVEGQAYPYTMGGPADAIIAATNVSQA
jgi:uncharacterized protein YdeI (BOF family)